MKSRMIAVTVCAAAILLAAGGAVAQVNIETVPVGNPGNPPDTRYEPEGRGSVGYVYNIGKYEVTNAEYCEFLNAVAAVDDPYELYCPEMASGYGGITQGGSPGSYTYAVRPGRGNMPVNWVSKWDTFRFANWLHNGQGSGDTETGAYTLTPDAIANNTVARNPGWQWAVTNHDEWYKAAYYDTGKPGGPGYWTFTTRTDLGPTSEPPPGTDMVHGSANCGYAVGDFTDVGAYTAKPSTSPYGTFDQGGNANEWIDWGVSGSPSAFVRGGSFTSTGIAGHVLGSGYVHAYVGMKQIGFRVVQVPEPAFAVLLIAGLGLVLRRRTNR